MSLFGNKLKKKDGNYYEDSTQEWLPIETIRDGIIVLKDGRYIKVVEVLPVNFYLKSDVEQENIIFLDKAMEFYEKKQFNDALELINKALAQDSTDSNAYYYRALVYDEQKKYNEAIADYNNAIKNNPEMTIVYYAMAIDYDYLKQYKNALLNYKKFLASTKEQNEYTKYSQQRVKDLHQYDTP